MSVDFFANFFLFFLSAAGVRWWWHQVIGV